MFLKPVYSLVRLSGLALRVGELGKDMRAAY